MTKLIELFEENLAHQNFDTHGFELLEVIENYQIGDLEEKVADIIEEDGSDALLSFQRGVKNGKIDLLDAPTTYGESLFVFVYNVVHGFFDMERCMGVFTEAQMEQYLEKYIEKTIKQKIYGLLDGIQKVMEAKNLNEANIELYEDFFNDCENASLSVKTINGEMVAKFNVDSEKENHSLTVTKCNEKQKLDSIVEAYEIFGYAFRTDEWEDILESLEIWIKQNNK
jgi:hypothetical protein